MKRLKLLSAALSVSCAVGVLMAVIVTGNQSTLPKTAVIVPTKNPILRNRQQRLRAPVSGVSNQLAQTKRGSPNSIDRMITSSISRDTKSRRTSSKRNIGNIIANVPAEQNPFPGSSKTVVVKSGDTLYAIARRTGVNVHKIAKLNAIDKPFVIRPGQILNLNAIN